MKTLFLVVPCYNEEPVLQETTKHLKAKLRQLIRDHRISKASRVLYVNDGSSDKTWPMICEISRQDQLFTGISLSRNMGHQNALLAGLMTAKNHADVIISLDADLQDDIDAIDAMLDEYEAGCDIVYGVRSKRQTDTFFKRFTAESFYKLMRLMGADVVYNHADYRLTSKRVLDHFADYEEVNLFLRGMFPLVGFKSGTVEYERHERFAGKSHYPVSKMFNFAWDGITSFSVKPVRFVLLFGILIFVVSLIVMIYSLIVKLLGQTVDGWTFIVCSIWVVGGIQMFSLGIIGEYIGKIYQETKHRPRYIIAENLLEQPHEERH